MKGARGRQPALRRLALRHGAWLAALLLAVASLVGGGAASIHSHDAHGHAHLHLAAHGHDTRLTALADREPERPEPGRARPSELARDVVPAPRGALHSAGARVEFPECTAPTAGPVSENRRVDAAHSQHSTCGARSNSLAAAARAARAPPRPLSRARKKRSTLARLLLTNRALRI